MRQFNRSSLCCRLPSANDCTSCCLWLFYSDKRNMLSKVSFFVRPKSPISSKISSIFLSFVQISSATERYLICKWTNLYWFQNLYRELQHFFIFIFLYITVDSFHWKVRANFLLCNRHVACTTQARSRLNRHGCASIAPHRRMPPTCRLRSAQGGLFDVPRSRMAFDLAICWPFFVQISSIIVNFVFHP